MIRAVTTLLTWTLPARIIPKKTQVNMAIKYDEIIGFAKAFPLALQEWYTYATALIECEQNKLNAIRQLQARGRPGVTTEFRDKLEEYERQRNLCEAELARHATPLIVIAKQWNQVGWATDLDALMESPDRSVLTYNYAQLAEKDAAYHRALEGIHPVMSRAIDVARAIEKRATEEKVAEEIGAELPSDSEETAKEGEVRLSIILSTINECRTALQKYKELTPRRSPHGETKVQQRERHEASTGWFKVLKDSSPLILTCAKEWHIDDAAEWQRFLQDGNPELFYSKVEKFLSEMAYRAEVERDFLGLPELITGDPSHPTYVQQCADEILKWMRYLDATSFVFGGTTVSDDRRVNVIQKLKPAMAACLWAGKAWNVQRLELIPKYIADKANMSLRVKDVIADIRARAELELLQPNNSPAHTVDEPRPAEVTSAPDPAPQPTLQIHEPIKPLPPGDWSAPLTKKELRTCLRLDKHKLGVMLDHTRYFEMTDQIVRVDLSTLAAADRKKVEDYLNSRPT